MQSDQQIVWYYSNVLVPYTEACRWQESTAGKIAKKEHAECVWLLEHPPMYTRGSSSMDYEYLDENNGIPVYPSGRGGRYTYHGPGQRVIYVLLNLNNRTCDLHAFLYSLEEWIIRALQRYSLECYRQKGKTGVWACDHTNMCNSQGKIAAIGVRVRKWITFHGIALNISTNLDDFRGIIPCGLIGEDVTSIARITGKDELVGALDKDLMITFEGIFGGGSTLNIKPHPVFE